MADGKPSRSELAGKYIDSLPYTPYPVQEEALLAWFTAEQGILMCAPTGTGKTLVAQGALFEALHRGETAYYTTPLIALTDQKFRELQALAPKWGFEPEDIGLVTGNHKVNPEARVLVVVAEILLNRLLNPSAFDFSSVAAVVMDEFHSFADPERGIVWELSLSMLPKHVRTMLLSATVGNAPEFMRWLQVKHGRTLEVVQDRERKVPLTYTWVGDEFLTDQLVEMARGEESQRKTPALVFCFNREECWTVAEQLKGLDLLAPEQRECLRRELDGMDWSIGVGAKMKQILWRGIGVHHAGMLPRYRRLVEDLYVRKLLSVCVCTETLAAGINLPARSVVLTTLLKGPPGRMRPIPSSTAHQIFGRAGRPQFDDRGYVYALAHEDDVRILRWQEKLNQLPEKPKDPGMIKARKALMKKKPTRRENQQYWTQAQFEKLTAALPGELASKGPLPWRLLAYLLKKSPEVKRMRDFVNKRLMIPARIEASQKALDQMLVALWRGGFVRLEPEPPAQDGDTAKAAGPTLSTLLAPLLDRGDASDGGGGKKSAPTDVASEYAPVRAEPTPALDRLLVFRSIHPIYGAFLLDYMGYANRDERIQILESVLEMPRPLLRFARVPLPPEMPPGPLAVERLDPELIKRGFNLSRASSEGDEDDETGDIGEPEGIAITEFDRPPTLAEKLRALFEETYPGIDDVRIESVWMAGEILRRGGDFNQYVKTTKLVKQEGIVFRHLLRLVLLCGEFAAICPEGTTPEEWRSDLCGLAGVLTLSCRAVDPQSTGKIIHDALGADVVEGEVLADGAAAPEPLQAEAKPVDPAVPDWQTDWEKQWQATLDELLGTDAT